MPPFKTSASFPCAVGCAGAELSNCSSESISGIKVATDEKQVAARHPGAAFPSLVRNRMVGPALHSRIFSFKKRHKEKEMSVRKNSQSY